MTKTRGLILSYRYCEDMKKGYDLWHIDPAAMFKSPWEAIRSLAEFFYKVWDEETVDAPKGGCCADFAGKTNADVYTEEVLNKHLLVPTLPVRRCPVCNGMIEKAEFNYEWLQQWIVEDFDTSPGDGGDVIGDYGPWTRWGALDSLIQYPKSWFRIDENADQVLALAVPAEFIPEGSQKEQAEAFEAYLPNFDDNVSDAYEAWRKNDTR